MSNHNLAKHNKYQRSVRFMQIYEYICFCPLLCLCVGKCIRECFKFEFFFFILWNILLLVIFFVLYKNLKSLRFKIVKSLSPTHAWDISPLSISKVLMLLEKIHRPIIWFLSSLFTTNQIGLLLRDTFVCLLKRFQSGLRKSGASGSLSSE